MRHGTALTALRTSGTVPAVSSGFLDSPNAYPLDVGAIDDLRALGGHAEVDRIVRRFIARLPERLEQIERAQSSADASTVRLHAHKLRSAAGFLGAVRFSALCRDLEELSIAGDLTAASGVVAQLTVESPLLLRALEALLEGAGHG